MLLPTKGKQSGSRLPQLLFLFEFLLGQGCIIPELLDVLELINIFFPKRDAGKPGTLRNGTERNRK